VTRPSFSVALAGRVDIGNPAGVFFDSIVNVSRLSSETTTGVSRRKPSGFIPPTGYSTFFRSERAAEGRCLYSIPGTPFGQLYVGTVGGLGGRFNSGDHFDSLMPEGVDAVDLINQSLIAARVKMKRTDVNLGVAFGERNATARMLGDTATRIAKSLKALKRGEIRNAMNQLGIASAKRAPRGGNVPQKWLELQYGWKPLLSDVYGAADALSKRPKGDWRVTAKATRSLKTEYAVTWNQFDMGRGSAKSDVSAFTRIDALPENDALISLASLGISNPLLIGWELVPFSFVVDWALPVGNYLDSLDAMLGYEQAYSSTSVRIKQSWSGTGRSGPLFAGFVSNSYKESKRVSSLQRSASSGVPMPMPPRLKDPRSLGHMANGLALLSQVFGRGTNPRTSPPITYRARRARAFL